MRDLKPQTVTRVGFFAAAIACSCFLVTPAAAEIIVPVIDQSQVDVTIAVDVEFDASTGLYTYNYQVTSELTSVQNVESVAIEHNAEIVNAQAPTGWDPGPVDGGGIFDFSAIETNPLPPDYVDTGNVPPSSVAIKPGETLGGFSLKSPEGPTTVLFYAQGFAPIPQTTGADFIPAEEIPDFTENSFIGFTIGPGRDDDIIFTGGRRPSVDGFLGFVGVNDRDTLSLPVALTLRLSVNGETVDASSFSASLNRVNVTNSFQMTGNGDELFGTFNLNDSPLVVGRNVLRTSIEGTVPGTSRTASDGDAFTFFID